MARTNGWMAGAIALFVIATAVSLNLYGTGRSLTEAALVWVLGLLLAGASLYVARRYPADTAEEAVRVILTARDLRVVGSVFLDRPALASKFGITFEAARRLQGMTDDQESALRGIIAKMITRDRGPSRQTSQLVNGALLVTGLVVAALLDGFLVIAGCE